MTGRFPWEEEEQDQAKVTPLVGGNPTNEEAEEAFEMLFEENTSDKGFNESRGNL